jgi:flagellar biosynthesis/type III secretory pathway protein FliH
MSDYVHESCCRQVAGLRAEIERLTAELFAAELRAKTYEEGYNESQEAIRYHQARVEVLENAISHTKAGAILDNGCWFISSTSAELLELAATEQEKVG